MHLYNRYYHPRPSCLNSSGRFLFFLFLHLLDGATGHFYTNDRLAFNLNGHSTAATAQIYSRHSPNKASRLFGLCRHTWKVTTDEWVVHAMAGENKTCLSSPLYLASSGYWILGMSPSRGDDSCAVLPDSSRKWGEKIVALPRSRTATYVLVW